MKQIRPERDFPNVSGGILFGMLAIVSPWALAEWLGHSDTLGAVISAFGSWSPLGLALLYGMSFLVIGGLIRGLFIILGISAFGGNRLLDRVAFCIAGSVRFVWRIIAGGIGLGVSAIRAVTRPLEAWIFGLHCRLQEEHQLWRSYREEFYQAYGSFAEFKRAFRDDEQDEPQEEAQQETPRAAPTLDLDLEVAFALFGLRPDCTKEEFTARFRELIRQVHPDKVGPNGMATQLNEARALIRKQKGWT